MPPKPQKPDKSANEVAYTKKRGKRTTKGGVVLANLVSPGARGRGNVPESKPTALKADRNKRAIGTYVDLAFAADALKKTAEEITPEELAEWQPTKSNSTQPPNKHQPSPMQNLRHDRLPRPKLLIESQLQPTPEKLEITDKSEPTSPKQITRELPLR